MLDNQKLLINIQRTVRFLAAHDSKFQVYYSMRLLLEFLEGAYENLSRERMLDLPETADSTEMPLLHFGVSL